MSDRYLPTDNECKSDVNSVGARTIFPAEPGWELITLEFGKDLDTPVVGQDPIVAWAVVGDHVYPVMPWAVFSMPFELDEGYRGYVCPSGVVIGGDSARRSNDVESFVETCKEVERWSRQIEREPRDSDLPF